jgi:Ca2+-binding EF-hand superfamily protein
MRLPLILAALVLAVPAAACATTGGRDPLKMLQEADANRDGVVTRAEFRDARNRLFDRLDRNNDGFVSQANGGGRLARRRGGGERMAQLMQAMDSDRDGRLGRREFVEGPSLFDRADRNDDGVVDRREMAEARDAVAAMRR